MGDGFGRRLLIYPVTVGVYGSICLYFQGVTPGWLLFTGGISRRRSYECPRHLAYSPKIAILDRDHAIDREKGWAIDHSAVCEVVAINDVVVESSNAAALRRWAVRNR